MQQTESQTRKGTGPGIWHSSCLIESMKNSPVVFCAICGQPITLEVDRCTDEKGWSVHEACYVHKITSGTENSRKATRRESLFDPRA
jgi:transcription elongation factor Elf1